MTTPAVSLLLCTVRESGAYVKRPEWDVIGKVVRDLIDQVDAPPFELVVVDGLKRSTRPTLIPILGPIVEETGVDGAFAIRHVDAPDHSPWARARKVAICAYRNWGIAHCRGELIVNLDDCCVLPPNFVSTFWRSWSQRKVAAAMTWPTRGDARPLGPTGWTGHSVYGFGSYPRNLALALNGYDEAYDGGQGLEDADWSIRLRAAGLHQELIRLDGFDIEPQSAHSAAAIDLKRPIVKCCNAAWQCERVARDVLEANRAELWTEEWLRKLVGPCMHLHGQQCGHHGDRYRCAYLEDGFAAALDDEAKMVFEHPPVLDLRRMSEARR